MLLLKQVRLINANVIEYLTFLYQEGKEYSTIYFSQLALFVTHPPIDGRSEGTHLLIHRFMQGLYNSLPSQLKYFIAWDVDQVVGYIRTLPSSKDLQLKDLILKLAVLMAVANADRSSDLAILDLNHHRYSEEGVTFVIP